MPSNQISSSPIVQLARTLPPRTTISKLTIAQGFWSALGNEGTYTARNLEPYFRYCAEQFRLYKTSSPTFEIPPFDEFVQIAGDLKSGLSRSETCQQLKGRLQTKATDPRSHIQDDELDMAIDLAARLLLMVDVGIPSSRMWTTRAYRTWAEGSIHDFLANIFQHQTTSRHDSIDLDRDFNAYNLEAIGGLKIELTNNLLDHLEVVDVEGETTVMIFHHAAFLRNQDHMYFPGGFVNETLQTLALLFPQNRWFRRTKGWYRKHISLAVDDADASILACEAAAGTNDIENYMYWHDRLVRLKLIYDQAKPRTARQWWNDRREGTQWYALWVVLGFTVFFGLVQSIEGAIQVYKSYH